MFMISYFLALLAQFTPHSDSITDLDFLEKDERIFLLTASSDCSVVLSDTNGNPYGTFGQPNQWRLDMDLSKITDEELKRIKNEDDEESQEENSKKFDEESRTALSQDLDDLSSMNDDEILTRRSNVWESTSIGNQINFGRQI
jgi:WD40 repeat protein